MRPRQPQRIFCTEKRTEFPKAHKWDEEVMVWDTRGSEIVRLILQFSNKCASFPGGTLVAGYNFQYDNRVVCDPRSLDAVIPDFLSRALPRRLETSARA